MVKPTPKNKYLRRYKTCFIIGMVILTFQILLVVNFLAYNKSSEVPEKWEPSDNDRDLGSNNEALNSARRSDDEETNLLAPQTKRSNNTIQLKLDEIKFDLPCQITEKQALSALNRAKSQKCKQLIANISCLSNENNLYPLELKSSCPSGNFKAGKELGCFKDEKNFRLLNGYYGVNKKENSPKYCISLCLQSGFPYAGVQYSHECFCGSEEPPLSSKIPDSSCNMKCPGNPHATCGGYYTINIFQTGIKKFAPQVANDTNSDSKPVKIAFLLTLNGRALRQVKRLIKILYHKDHYYHIHIDVRQDYLFRELLPLEKFPNIRLTRRRFATIWGGASLLEMLRSCMMELLNIKEWNWDFVLNLSESDFPVKRIDKLTRFLSGNRNRNFVKSHGREVQRFIQKQGLDKTFVECEYRMWRVGNRKLPFGIQVDGGSDWIALSRPFVEYVANPDPDSLVTGLLKVFRHTLLPAESFFHTVLRNSRFCDSYVDNNLHVTNWKRKLGCKCQYKHVVDWCGCSPNDFRPEDWQKVLNTLLRPLYFARKFEPIVNQAVILQLELWLYNLEKPSKEVPNLNSYWQNIYHHRDLSTSFDDALMTLSNSIARRTQKILANGTSCNFMLIGLEEVNSFQVHDNYKYTLFMYNGSFGSVEVAIKPVSKVVMVKSASLMESLQSLMVSPDYDQKEQLSRNFLRLLSPYSDPILIYKFRSFKTSKQFNLTTLWIDPVGSLRDVVGFSVDEGSLVGHVKTSLKQPHLPGSWKVKLIYQDSLQAELSFLITPMQYLFGHAVAGPEISFLHSGLNYNSNFDSSYSKFLPNISRKEVLEQDALKNSQKHGDSLLEWIDSLVGHFYTIEKVCAIEDNIKGVKMSKGSETRKTICGRAISECQRTVWSSLSPDPKSAIGDLNESTGMFDIW